MKLFKTSEIICRQGSVADSIYVVMEGEVKLVQQVCYCLSLTLFPPPALVMLDFKPLEMSVDIQIRFGWQIDNCRPDFVQK